MAISPEAYIKLNELGDGVDHPRLDHEAGQTRGTLASTDSIRSRVVLLLREEPFAATNIRALDVSPTLGHAKHAGEIKEVAVEGLEVDPGRHHLGMLAAAMAVIEAYPTVDHIRYSPEAGSLDTLRGVSLHLLGWRDEIEVDKDSGQLSLVRDTNLARAA